MIKHRKSFFIRSLSLIVTVFVLFSLFGCNFFRTPTSKDTIREKIAETVAEDTQNYKYVGYYLDDWGFPAFDSFKVMSWAENVFQKYYNFLSV